MLLREQPEIWESNKQLEFGEDLIQRTNSRGIPAQLTWRKLTSIPTVKISYVSFYLQQCYFFDTMPSIRSLAKSAVNSLSYSDYGAVKMGRKSAFPCGKKSHLTGHRGLPLTACVLGLGLSPRGPGKLCLCQWVPQGHLAWPGLSRTSRSPWHQICISGAATMCETQGQSDPGSL